MQFLVCLSCINYTPSIFVRTNQSDQNTNGAHELDSHCDDEKSEKEKSNSISVTYLVISVICAGMPISPILLPVA